MSDPLSDILTGIDIRATVFGCGEVRAPWGFESEAEGRAIFHAVVTGDAWFSAGKRVRPVTEGEVLLLSRGARHRLGSIRQKASPPLSSVVEHRPAEPFPRFVVGGNGPATFLVSGAFEVDGLDFHPLLKQLPDLLLVGERLNRWLPSTLTALHRELTEVPLGASLSAQRLCEVLFVQIVAGWMSSSEGVPMLAEGPIGRAIGLIHREPGQPWSSESLAKAIGMSRSSFYDHFTSVVEETPAAYVKRWRMTLAARALRTQDVSLGELAERLGYSSESSFSRAFRDEHGVNPGAYRRQQADADDPSG